MAMYHQATQSDEPFIEEVATPPSSKLWRRFGLMACALSIAVIVVGLIWPHPSTPMQQMQISSTALLDDITASLPHEMQLMLDQHNIYRCMHGLPHLTWDEGIAAQAQEKADEGSYNASSTSGCDYNGEICGEKLDWGEPHLDADSAARDWYQQIEHTSPYGRVTSMDDDTKGYTQIVWRATTKLGCGKGRADSNGRMGDMWVCQYSSAGNTAGQFEQNVPAPTLVPSVCGGSDQDVPDNFPAHLVAPLADEHDQCGGTSHTQGAPTECKAPFACKEVTPRYSECQRVAQHWEYYMMEQGSCCCPDHQKMATVEECKEATNALGLEHSLQWAGTTKHVPFGCSWRDPSEYPGHESMHFIHADGPEQGRFDLSPICKQLAADVIEIDIVGQSFPTGYRALTEEECRGGPVVNGVKYSFEDSSQVDCGAAQHWPSEGCFRWAASPNRNALRYSHCQGDHSKFTTKGHHGMCIEEPNGVN